MPAAFFICCIGQRGSPRVGKFRGASFMSRPNSIADCAVIDLGHRRLPLPRLLRTRFSGGSPRCPPGRAVATVRHGILVARLAAFLAKHSFSTFSKILRNLKLDYPSGFRSLLVPAEIPLGVFIALDPASLHQRCRWRRRTRLRRIDDRPVRRAGHGLDVRILQRRKRRSRVF